ncbi:hypothetical protein, partial [Shewanella sp.]
MLNKKILAVVVASTLGLGACGSNDSKDTVAADIKLRVMETTDLHTNMMDYNYYSGKEDKTIGLV